MYVLIIQISLSLGALRHSYLFSLYNWVAPSLNLHFLIYILLAYQKKLFKFHLFKSLLELSFKGSITLGHLKHNLVNLRYLLITD